MCISLSLAQIPEDDPIYMLPYHYAMYFGTACWRQIMTGLTYDVHEKVRLKSVVSAGWVVAFPLGKGFCWNFDASVLLRAFYR